MPSLIRLFLPFLATIFAAAGATASGPVRVDVTNTLDFARNELIELSAPRLTEMLGASEMAVTDYKGRLVPCQITHDSLLVFPVEIGPNGHAVFTIDATSETPATDTIATGRLYPERADDLAWENDLVAFRAYGPATERNGERAFGYDIFFKHPSPQPVVPILYAAQTSADNWHKVDSLRRIDPQLASEFEHSFTYHVDHGLGMDCYAVGATLGAGVAVPVVNDSLQFAWCYDKAEILDNGPLRFTVRLDFRPRTIGGNPAVVEHRLISLDAGSHLNRTEVWYDGLNGDIEIAAGFPLRDESPTMSCMEMGVLAYADPTQGPDNGKALLGVVVPGNAGQRKLQGHVVAVSPLKAGEPYRYQWGFAWDRADIPTLRDWTTRLIHAAHAARWPLQVRLVRQ